MGLGACDLLHPRLMYSGVFRYHWSQRSAMDHLLLHARYERFEIPEPGEIEGRLPEDYYAVRFYSRESFGDSLGNRSFVRHTIERMLERRDVVLLDSPFAVDDHANVEWMKAAGNGSRYNNRLVRAEEWMVPRNNLDVQSRIIARSHCFVGHLWRPVLSRRLLRETLDRLPRAVQGRHGFALQYCHDAVPRARRAAGPVDAG